ncbi:XrtB/PEP-CTERM-associated polysaccharide biosynthesis outer membrane protein EpsL [Arhodomonas sp. AD133]|uniref:XrtB/PEP-CTERM-associated polysaccharide biosynthesis outer membrane protein EpsL n=1 Tax=Arhodomonas sp. AD133 TaxID=3415009 RepID=UPI003EBDD758
MSQIRLGATAAALCVVAFAVHAQPPALAPLPEGETLGPYVYAGSRYDSNPFRVSGDDEAEERLDTGDFDDLIHRAGAGVRMNWPISLQTLRLDAWLERNRYQRFDELDHTAGDAELAWDWEIGRRFGGTIETGYARELTRFEENQSVERDIKTTRRYSADGGYRFLPDWEVRAGVAEQRQGHDRRETLDRHERSRFAELAYESPTGSRVGLRAERTDADLESTREGGDGAVIDNDYAQDDYSVVLGWAVTAQSRLTGRAGYTRREFDEARGRDFSGTTARLTYDWQPTVKLGLRLSGWRELQARDDDAVSYVLARGVGLEPTWQATPDVTLRGSLAWQRSEFQADDEAGVGNAGRDDTTRTVGVGVDYRALRNLRVSLGIEREVRNSNRAVSDYDYEQVSAGVSYAF